MRRRSVLRLPGVLAFGGPAVAQSVPVVDQLLVLAVDASGSIDANEFRLQREGLAEALSDPAVLSAIRSKPAGAIAVAVVEWGSPGGAETVVDWMPLRDSTSAAALGQAVMDVPRSRQSWNAIGDAIDHAVRVIAAAPFRASEKVIDISGDGPDLRSLRPALEARDAAVASGIVVNGLAIEIAPVTRRGEPLHLHYEREVIGGPGAFVMVTESRRDFARAMRAKLIREIAGAGRPPVQT